MINLNEKFVCIEYSCYGRECPDTHKVINLIQYNEAVAFYLDARDNPEKHFELIAEFLNMPNENYNKLSEWARINYLDLLDKAEWRDWLFKKIFEGE